MYWKYLLSFPLVIGLVYSSSSAAPSGPSNRPPLALGLQYQGFEHISTKRGVRVFKHRESENIRIAGEAELPVPAASLRDALLDYPRQVGAIERLSESQILRRGTNWLIVYQRLNLPIISDRDFTLLVRWGQEGDVFWITYQAANAGPPPRDGIVRVTNHQGSWQLRPVNGGESTFVRFEAEIDLAGWLPKWLARSGAGKEIPSLFGSICGLAIPANRRGSCP
jgi:hypothetical protein